jgi:hypothetical protein
MYAMLQYYIHIDLTWSPAENTRLGNLCTTIHTMSTFPCTPCILMYALIYLCIHKYTFVYNNTYTKVYYITMTYTNSRVLKHTSVY